MEMIELTTVTLERASDAAGFREIGGRGSARALRLAVERCGYHCAGLSVPAHFCDAVAEPGDLHAGRSSAHPADLAASKERHEHAGHGRPVDYATSTGGPSSVRRTR